MPITTRKDMGMDALAREIETLKRSPFVRVGILARDASKTYEGGVTVLQVAAANEFGTSDGRIPERAFMRTGCAEAQPKVQKLIRQYLAKLSRGEIPLSIGHVLDLAGAGAAAVIRRKIATWTTPPNAPSTIMQKARKAGMKAPFSDATLATYDAPLRDSGQLGNSIKREVDLAGGGRAP